MPALFTVAILVTTGVYTREASGGSFPEAPALPDRAVPYVGDAQDAGPIVRAQTQDVWSVVLTAEGQRHAETVSRMTEGPPLS